MSGIGRRALQDIAGSLSARDWTILRFLSTHKFASTTHLCRMHFTAHATSSAATRACLRVLDRLLERRLVARLDRRIGGIRHGSAGFIWHLDVAGERLTRPRGAPRRHVGDPTTAFLDHHLQVTETVVTLHELSRNIDLELAAVLVETEAWRTFLTSHGTTAMLKPDLFATLATSEFEDHWYIEIDRGTESTPVLLAKCRVYAAYKATGRAQAEHGVFPRVLWVVPKQRRVQRLQSAIHADLKLPHKLFTIITPDQLTTTIDPIADTASTESRKEEP
ncbi:replication-relaxation family protein [Microbacterium sp. HMH0099]|uniref:replication-relaxation family protein n=1 Tax=Microbacterium sp. HMH0099 TaxID=3414026 RepID=UPI003BF72753